MAMHDPIDPRPYASYMFERDAVKPSIRIDGVIRAVVADAQRFTEVQMVLVSYLIKSRNIALLSGNDYFYVQRDGLELFESPSYTSCLEFALKQPLIEGK